MSDTVDISVAISEDQVSISTTEVGIPEINAIPNVIEVNIVNATTINPLFYDLSDFTNTSIDPFTRVSSFKTLEGMSLIGSGDIDLTKNSVGLGNVDNTSDLNKPISTATQTALNNKVPTSRTLTINGTTQDLSADRTFTVTSSIVIGSTPITSGTVGRVLFEGTGNVVQESANLFWDATNSRLGIGNNSPQGALHISDESSADPLLFYKYSDNASLAGGFFASRLRGTISAPTAVQAGDRILSLFGRSYRTSGGNAFNGYSAAITFIAGENITSTANGSLITFDTTQNGTTTRGERARITGTGNLLINTITDSGFRLDVAGTARIANQLTTTGTINAATAIARGTYFNQTLVATANNDVLVGLDIQPTFTLGAFTGVTSYLFRAGSGIAMRSDGVFNWGNSLTSNNRGILTWDTDRAIITSGSASTSLDLGISLNTVVKIFPTRNVVIQSGGTFTDAGFRLDVAGPTRLNGLQTFQGTTASDTPIVGSELAAVTGTGTNWALASGATNLNVGGYKHTAGSTADLTTALAPLSGAYYQIIFTITGRTAGSISIKFGGYISAAFTTTSSISPLTSSTSTLAITPTNDFDGTVVISIKQISATSAISTWTNSSGTAVSDFRADAGGNVSLGTGAGRRLNYNLGYNQSIYNTFIGGYSGYNNTGGRFNTFVGYQSGNVNVLGNSCTFIGYGAGGNSQVDLNSFFGSLSGSLTTIGFSNSFFGANSGLNNTSGIGNCFFGVSAGQANTIGGTNSYFGVSAGLSVSSGSNNTFIGSSAGRFISGGVTALTSLSNSILIGMSAYPLADSQTNQIVIGFGSVGLGSNTTVLGNTSIVSTAIAGSVSIATGSQSVAVTSAQLQVDSTTKGFLCPRMTTTQKNAITSPATGLVVFDTTLNKLCVYTTAWETITSI